MKLRGFSTAIAITALCAAVVFRTGSAEPPAKNTGQDSLEMRYARLRLRMAEIGLEKARRMNQKVAGALPADLVAQYADDVTVAKAQVQNTMRAGGSELFQSWIVRAEMALQAAKVGASNATRTEQRTPGTYDPIDIERRHLAADLAQLRLDRGKSLLNASPDAKLQWVVDMVDDELARLKKRTALLVQVQGPSDL